MLNKNNNRKINSNHTNNENNNNDDMSSHIYENIDEFNIYSSISEKNNTSVNSNSSHERRFYNKTGMQNRRGRFQALKRNSSINGSTNNRIKIQKQQSESPTSQLSNENIISKFKSTPGNNSNLSFVSNGASSSSRLSNTIQVREIKTNRNKQEINQLKIIKSQSEQFL